MGGWGRHADSLEGRRDNMVDDKAGQSGVFALCFISVQAECHFLTVSELIAQAGRVVECVEKTRIPDIFSD